MPSPPAQAATPLVSVCAWCDDLPLPNVTHTICPRCLQRMIDELEAT